MSESPPTLCWWCGDHIATTMAKDADGKQRPICHGCVMAKIVVGKQRPQDIMKTRKVGRNEPCPCGSGKKHKRCHGAPR